MKNKLPFSSEERNVFLQRVEKILSEKMSGKRENLFPVVEEFLERRRAFLSLAEKYQTPFYILDSAKLKQSIDEFEKAFTESISGCKVYYAMKTNHHPYILKTVTKKGWGLDISSVREFDLARESGCRDMIFTGPGKSTDDFRYVLEKDQNITINIDSFGELERLGTVSKKLKRKIKAGVRIYTSVQKKWSKFGIPLQELKMFWKQAKEFPLIHLQGIQFHLSWNEDASPYEKAIIELSVYLRNNFNEEERASIRFIDFGGGFLPHRGEWIYPWLTPQGGVIKTVNDYFNMPTNFNDTYFITPSIPINDYAIGIGNAITKYLSPLVNCHYYTEPGRIISNNSMHIVSKVIDKKNQRTVIMDGGINMVGWDKFEYYYFPVINLSHPSIKEHKCMVYGPLCMTQDLWGYYYYGSKIEDGDICIVPYQGCLTYSLAQDFIRPIPKVYILK